MFNDYLSWDTPWELYFHALIFIPIIQRLIFLGEPALKAVQIHGHHLKWIFERLREIPKGYSIAAKFTVGLLVPATIALMRFVIFEPEDGEQNFKKNLLENELKSCLVFFITIGVVLLSVLINV